MQKWGDEAEVAMGTHTAGRTDGHWGTQSAGMVTPYGKAQCWQITDR